MGPQNLTLDQSGLKMQHKSVLVCACLRLLLERGALATVTHAVKLLNLAIQEWHPDSVVCTLE